MSVEYPRTGRKRMLKNSVRHPRTEIVNGNTTVTERGLLGDLQYRVTVREWTATKGQASERVFERVVGTHAEAHALCPEATFQPEVL